MNKKFVIIFMVLFPLVLSAQFSDFHADVGVGFGAIQGESTAQSSLNASVNFSFKHDWTGDVSLNFGYLAARHLNYFLPENRRNRYYPWQQAILIKGSIEQFVDRKIFLEESVGLASINDRTFSDVNEWDFGVTAGVMIGIDLRNFDAKGFRIGIGGEFAETFTGTTASFYILNFRTQYFF